MKTTKNFQMLLLCMLSIGYVANAQDYNDYKEAMKRAENAAAEKSSVIVQKREVDTKSQRLSSDLIRMSESTGLDRKTDEKASLMEQYKQKYIIRDNKVIVEIVAFTATDAAEIKKTLEADKTILNVVSFDTHVSCLIPMNKLMELSTQHTNQIQTVEK
jgi:predicted DsbA family dithiol-disulfide isomerase